MESRNPVFSRSKAFSQKGYATFNDAPTATAGQLEDMYTAPSATSVDTGRMTMDDVVIKTGIMFAVLLPLAAINYVIASPLLTFGGVIVGLVLGLIVSFKQSTNPALILSYAAAEGLFIGGISQAFEDALGGHRPAGCPRHPRGLRRGPGGLQERQGPGHAQVPQDRAHRDGRLPGLLPGEPRRDARSVAAASSASGRGRWASRSACSRSAWPRRMLILDFDFAEQGVKNGIPERYSWLAAFGLVVTLVWLYIEMLRLIAILRGD